MVQRCIHILLFLLLLAPGLAYGNGSLSGFVSDSNGVNISGARITGPSGSTFTDAHGHYSLSHPAGSFSFTASATGYASAASGSLTITDNFTTDHNFTLADMYLASTYPRLGLLGSPLDIEIYGDGFDANTRLSLMPDSGNRLDVIGKFQLTGNPDDPYLYNTVSIAASGSLVYVVDMFGHGPNDLGALYIIDIDNPALQANPTNPVLRGTLFLDKPDDEDNNEYGLDLAIHGNYAYITYGKTDNGTGGLLIADISDPQNPQMRGAISTLDVAYGVEVSGNTAYVVDGECGSPGVGNLHAINVADPDSPSIEWSLDTSFTNCASDLSISGNLAYIANEWLGLKIIDIDPASSDFKQTLNPPTPPPPAENLVDARGVEVVDSIAYLAAESDGLLLYDVSNPESPVKLGDDVNFPTDTPGFARRVKVENSFAYVADNVSGLAIFDVRDLNSPKFAGTIDSEHGAAYDLVLSGNLALVANGSAGLGVFDVRRPEKPALAGSIRSIDYATDVLLDAVGDSHTLYLSYADGLKIIDATDPSTPVITSSIRVENGTLHRLKKVGSTIYGAAHYGDLKIIDINDKSVTEISIDNGQFNHSWSVDTDSDFIYVADGDCDSGERITDGGLNLVDISDPANASLHQRIDLDGCVTDVAVIDKKAYVSVYVDQSGNNDDNDNGVVDNGLKIVNVDQSSADYTFGQVIGSYSINNRDSNPALPMGSPSGLTVVSSDTSSYAYLAASWGGLVIIDVTNPETPQLMGFTGTLGHEAKDVQVVGSTAYIADYNSGVYVVDVSDAAHPVVIGSVDTPGFAENLAVDGDVAHVADGLSGLSIVSLPFEFTLDINELESDRIHASLPSGSLNGHYIIRAFHDSLDISDTLLGAVTFSDTIELLTSKAIIVAGGGAASGLDIWEDTKAYANYAYDNLIYQGYKHEDITYITDQPDPLGDRYSREILDAHARVETAEKSALRDAVLTWAKGDASTSDLLIYMADHGDTESFLLRGGPNPISLTADELDAWLDELQCDDPAQCGQPISGKVIVIYDACRSGSFISRTVPPTGKTRFIMTSSEAGQTAYFLSGSHSFSSHFWSTLSGNSGNSADLSEAFVRATDTMALYQNGQLDANGNGVANETEDITALQGHEGTIHAIRRQYSARDRSKPVIGGITGDLELSGGLSATLSAYNIYDIDGDAIAEVWAEIISPDYNPDPDGVTVSSLPTVVLQDMDNDRVYTAVYSNFLVQGTYIVNFYAMDTHGIISLPKTTLVTQTSGTSPAAPDQYEIDNEPELANVIHLNSPAPQIHTFHQSGDTDWVTFYGLSGITYRVKAFNPTIIADPVITLFGPDGTSVLASSNTAGPGRDESLVWTCPSDDVYFVRIENGTDHFGANVRYHLKITDPTAFSFPGYVEGTITGGGSVIGGAALHGGGGSGISLSNGYYILCLYPGSHSINVSKSGYQSASFGVTILSGVSVIRNVSLTENNRPPTIGGNPPLIAYTNQLYSFRPNSSDPDGDTLSFTATGIPSWASLNGSTGELSGVAGDVDIGTHGPIGITVSDYQYSASLADFSITVLKGSNLPPVISGTIPSKISADRMFRFTPYATDPNGDTLQFSISNKPGWAAFNSGNGSLSGIPGKNNIGTHGPVRLIVKDPFGAHDSLTFWLVVVPESEIDKYGALPGVFLLLKN